MALQGDVLSKQDLDWVKCSDAKSIIILNEEESSSRNQYNTSLLKILMNMKPVKSQTVIAEIYDEETQTLIQNTIGNRYRQAESHLILLNESEIMGDLLAQVMISPVLNLVYMELLSFNKSEFYISNEKIEFHEYLKKYSHSIPLFSRRYDHQEELRLVVSDNASDFQKTNSTSRISSVKNYPLVKKSLTKIYKDLEVLIVGSNTKNSYIMSSIVKFKKEKEAQINIQNKSHLDDETMAEIRENKFNVIVLLASDAKNNVIPSDFDSITNLLKIYDFCHNNHTEIIVELDDNRNYETILEYGVEYIILCNRYFSKMITQISKDYRLYPFILDLLTFDAGNDKSYEIYIYKARDLIEINDPIVFSSKMELIQNMHSEVESRHIVVIGKVIEEGTSSKKSIQIFSGDLYTIEELIIHPDTELIVISN